MLFNCFVSLYKLLRFGQFRSFFGQFRSFSEKHLRNLVGHLKLLLTRIRADLSDPSQTWLVIVTCLLSCLMALRMADVAGWVHFGPLVRIPLPGNTVLLHESRLFWDSVTNARLGCVALVAGSLLTIISRLERWETSMVCGLYVLMSWWYVTAATMVFELGLGIGGLYCGIAALTSITTVKTYRMFHFQTQRTAEVDNAVLLIQQILDAFGIDDTWLKTHVTKNNAANNTVTKP